MDTEIARMETQSSKPDLISPCGRSFGTSWPIDIMGKVGMASFGTFYRGVHMFKNALDLMIYMQLLERLKPNTIIEIGSKSGGSALWFADTISAAGRKPHIVSVDLEPPPVVDERIQFIKGDALNLGAVLTDDLLATLPRPWVITEDSAHIYETSRAVLDFFDHRLVSGETIVIEDGLAGEFYYVSGVCLALAGFLKASGSRYRIDNTLCDFFGYNATMNPNGWLTRI
jgi:cephalosporin hydroxylase